MDGENEIEKEWMDFLNSLYHPINTPNRCEK